MQCKQQGQSGINTEVLNRKQQTQSYLHTHSLRYSKHSGPRGGTFISGARYIAQHMFPLTAMGEEITLLFICTPESLDFYSM